jgi:hypothetical protein
MQHSGESRIQAMRHSAESILFFKKVVSATPCYATQCEIQVKNFLVDSALCGIVGSRDSALCGIAQSCDSALCSIVHSRDSLLWGIAQSRYLSSNSVEDLREFESICKAHKSGDPGVQFNEKTKGQKSRDTVPLRPPNCPSL